MSVYSIETEAKKQKKLDDAIRDARGVARQHKELDVRMAKQSCNMTLQEIKLNKVKLKELKEQLKKAVKKVLFYGGSWDNEQERATLDAVA